MTTKKLKKEFDKAKKLCEVATEGVWTFEEDMSQGPRHATHTIYSGRAKYGHGLNLFGRMKIDWNGENNLAFICAARETLPKALDHIEKQEKEIARLRKKLGLTKK